MPFLFERHYFIKAYDYWNGYTRAQIELMSIDVPIIVYKKNKDGEVKHTKKEFDNIMDKWKAKKAADEAKGIRVGLNDFLNRTNTKQNG